MINVGDFRFSKDIKAELKDVIKSNRISEGLKVKLFETKWAKYIGTKYCVLVNSGTSALIASILAMKILYKIPDGSKVITTPLTYIATLNAIKLNNLEPVFIDVAKDSFNIDLNKLEEYLENCNDLQNHKLIIPVHLFGYPVDMDKLMRIASKYKLKVIEDAAQAHGTLAKNNRKVGSFGSLACYSFYIAHNIQAGELGAIVTNNIKLYQLIKQLKANGRLCKCVTCTRAKGKCPYANKDINPRFTHEYISYNFKTTEFNAAVALGQFKKVNVIFKKRQENVKKLNKLLSKHQKYFQLPAFDKRVSYLAYPIIIKKGVNRSKITNFLEKKGIETRPIFGSIPTQQLSFKEYKKDYIGKLPNADYIGKYGFYIGCHQYLTKADLNKIGRIFTKTLCFCL